MDGSGNIYVADTYNYTIRKITPGGVVTTLAGSPNVLGAADGTGSAAQFNLPGAVAANSTGTLYVADTYNSTIRKITPAGVVTTLAGSAGIFGASDGTGASALFMFPTGLAVDGNGFVYVADTSNANIRKITAAGLVTTIGGLAGAIGASDGSGARARFNSPAGIAATAGGRLFIADAVADRIIRGLPILSDFDHNGTPDLVVFNPSTGQNLIELLIGNTYVYNTSGPAIPLGWQLVKAGDFDGDGKPDYYLFKPATGQLVVWTLEETATYAGITILPNLPAGWQLVGVADLNADGKPDLVLFYPTPAPSTPGCSMEPPC